MLYTILTATLLACAAPADSVINLDGVTIKGKSAHDYQMKSSQTGIDISHDFLQTNMSGSLMQTLENIPGVKAMKIGSGQSKPAIRGFGFNRMVVAENGIKHEGQQWGDDHGLEIDQFAIDRAEIVKGPAAILYGSDAIGGVVNLYSNNVPISRFEGTLNLFGRSNNDLAGISAKIGGRNNMFFYRAILTTTQYADYKVPTDSIQYYSYYIKLRNRRMRNTAGLERDMSLALGLTGFGWRTVIHISDSYTRSGFFANAHGLEVRLSDIDYDTSTRDVDLPYQSVNHLKIVSNTMWQNERISANADMAFQKNHREECSEPVSHGYMPTPPDAVERQFDKETYTANLGLRILAGERNELRSGISYERQHNRRSGWGFIIPDFDTNNIGAYLFCSNTTSNNLKINAGIRFDHATTDIGSYTDWFSTPNAEGDSAFKQRSNDIRLKFNSLTWSTGLCYSRGNWILKSNIGKSFRMPIPKELGADGINYHIFRYERGNEALTPEKSYQIDVSVIWDNDVIHIQSDPYVNYFPNYIYLCPTAEYVEGLQLYNYTQAKVLRYGIETQTICNISKRLTIELKGEYLFARQRSGEKRGYTLPFSTPWSADATLKYAFHLVGDANIALNTNIVGRQNEIVPPEKPTDGHCTLNASFDNQFRFKNHKLRLSLHADNLLNTKYFDHTSYYRLINVPEPGRHFSCYLIFDL